LYQNEALSALDQLRKRASKEAESRKRASKEAELRRKREEKEGEERELQRVRKEVLTITCVIYNEQFASRPPPIF
jgi:hypothetical protein